MEEFKKIKGHENYFVSTFGRVRNDIKNTYVGRKKKNGYMIVTINYKTYKIHRLVLKAFKPNPMPFTYTEVDHIDHDRSNNHIDNLQWISHWQNNYGKN